MHGSEFVVMEKLQGERDIPETGCATLVVEQVEVHDQERGGMGGGCTHGCDASYKKGLWLRVKF
jgi:hypothetical protein